MNQPSKPVKSAHGVDIRVVTVRGHHPSRRLLGQAASAVREGGRAVTVGAATGVTCYWTIGTPFAAVGDSGIALSISLPRRIFLIVGGNYRKCLVK